MFCERCRNAGRVRYTEGQCTSHTAGGLCETQVVFGVQSGVLSGVAGVALVAGVIVLAVQPIPGEPVRVAVSGGPASLSLTVDGMF